MIFFSEGYLYVLFLSVQRELLQHPNSVSIKPQMQLSKLVLVRISETTLLQPKQ